MKLNTGTDPTANFSATAVDAGGKTTQLRASHASEARWRSGDAEDCKSLHPGSIPGRASTFQLRACRQRRCRSNGRKRMPRQITVGQNIVLTMSDEVSSQRHDP